MSEYQDFDLEIRRSADGYTARVLSSPAGEAEESFTLPFSPIELENFILKLGFRRRTMRGTTEVETLTRNWGTRLFSALMVGQLASRFDASRTLARERNVGLRIRMRLSSAPELIDVPWEYLYDPADRDFIASSKYTPIVRYLHSPQAIQPQPVSGALCVLVVIATPPGLPALNVAREVAQLKAAMEGLERSGKLRLEFMEHATYARLQKTLRRTDAPVHILHFIGHGHYEETSETGALVFESDTGLDTQVRASELARVLVDHRSLRLVTLNSCEGGRTSKTDPFGGVAQTLVRRGLPAVVAMQFEVSDEAACQIAERLYESLCDGLDIESALGEVRISLLGSGNAVEWATPVLYMREVKGKLFAVDADARPIESDRTQSAQVKRDPPIPPPPPQSPRSFWRSWKVQAGLAATVAALLIILWLRTDKVVVHNQYGNEVTFTFGGAQQTLQQGNEWSSKGTTRGTRLELYSCGWEDMRTSPGQASGCRWIPYTVFAGETWDIVPADPIPRIVLRQRR